LKTLREFNAGQAWKYRLLFIYYRVATWLTEALWELRRWRWVMRSYRNYAAELNRRAAVEQQLWDCWHGKRPLPDKAQCAEWARKLGVPEEFR
jgi:hypothetical protein